MAAEVDAETGEVAEAAFPPVRIDRKFVMQQGGRDFVLSDGLLDGLHQLSRGFFEVETKIEQLPTAENGQTAVVSAVVTVFAPYDGRVLRRASDIGDASPASVGRNIAPHLIRMASTRATSRALRTLLNEGSVAFEELGPGGAEAPADERTPAADQNAPVRPSSSTSAPAPERILISGKAYDRPQVVAGYRKVLAEARDAGLTSAPADLVPEDAPLALLAGAAQSLRRRLDARSGAVHANGAGGK